MAKLNRNDIKKFKDWGMILTPSVKSDDENEDKKPWKKKGYIRSADWTDDDLLKADRISLFHQPQKLNTPVNGKNYLTIDFDDPEFVASSFSFLFPVSFTIGKKDSTGLIKTTHIEYEVNSKDVPDKLPSYLKVIEALGTTSSVIAGVDRYTIIDMKPVLLSSNQVKYVLRLVRVVNFLTKEKKLYDKQG